MKNERPPVAPSPHEKLVPFWVSFWATDLTKFEYHGPWWVSGYRTGDTDEYDVSSVCAAVMAKDEDGAKRVIEKSFDAGHGPDEWRFVSSRAPDWSPFCDRFERRSWMKWPWPEGVQSDG